MLELKRRRRDFVWSNRGDQVDTDLHHFSNETAVSDSSRPRIAHQAERACRNSARDDE